MTSPALAITALAAALFDLPWHSVALALLAAGTSLILVLLMRLGVNPHDAFVEMIGREASGTLTDYRPTQGAVEALLNMLPLAIAFVALVVLFGLQ